MEYIRLGDVISAAKTTRCGENDFPILSITKSDGIVLQSEKFKKRIASNDTADYKIVYRGQLVQGIHIDEANFGIQEVVDTGIVSPAYKIWNIKNEVIVPKYLEIVLRSPRSIAYYESKFNGSIKRRERLSDKDFLEMKIPCPSVGEQIHVISVLAKVNTLITQRKQQLIELDNLIKARFVELFGHQSHNEKNMTYGKIDDVAEIYLGLTHTPTYVEDGVKFISAKNTSCDYLDLSDVKYISREEFEKASKGTKPQIGDVLFSRVGSNLGHPVILDVEEELCTFVSLGFLRTKGTVTNVYLKHWMRDDFFAEQVAQKVVGGGQPNLNTGWLKEFKIIIPPMSLQNEFTAFVEQTDKSKVVVQKALDEAQTLFDSLMQEYFG